MSRLPSTLHARLQQALVLHRGGRVAEAEAVYRSLLDTVPGHPDVLHLLGTALTQLGRPAEAVPLLEQAAGRLPGSSPCQAHLGDALAGAGRPDEAEAAWRRAVELDPGNAEAGFALSGHLASAGRWSEAEPFARQVVELLPDSAPARFRLGLALEALGRPCEALAEYRVARRSAPQDADLLRRMRSVAIAAGDHMAAWRSVQRLAVLQPMAVDTFLAVAAVSQSAGQEQLRWARRGTTVAPADGSLRGLAAGLRVDAGDYDGALEEARCAIALNPAAFAGYVARARPATILSQFDVTDRAARRGLCIAPGDAELNYQRAQSEKATGDLRRAWSLDEHRIRSSRFHAFAGLPPRWPGPGYPVGRLLVATEQGIGDELLFMSCLPDLLADVPEPVVELDDRLHPLFRRSFPGLALAARQAFRGAAGGVVFEYGRLCAEYGITHHLHAGSLPALYRPERSRPATRAGYLRADPSAGAAWRERLAALGPEPKVGVCWRSVLRTAIRSTYYASLLEWQPMLCLRGIRFVCLQYDDCDEELADLERRTGVALWKPDGLDQMNDLDGTAALISALDAVVSAPTTVCMLAAALGVETHRLGHSVYAIGTTHDHFFPTMHPLVRADRPLDLADAIRRAAGLLGARLGGQGDDRFV